MNELQKIDRVLNITSKVCNVDYKLLKTKSRKLELNIARQIACVLSMKHLGIHKVKVAKRINRDRTSMNHYMRNHENNYNGWKIYQHKYDEVFAKLLKGNRKRKILHKNKFTNIVSKIHVTNCKAPDVSITVTCGKYKHEFYVGVFNFERDINTIGYCYASNNYFAELYGVSKNTVSRWISDLNKLGFINIEVERNEKKQVIKRKIGINQKDDRAIYKMSKENTTSVNNTSNINITKEKFIAEVMTFDYPKDMLEDFINYWTEGKKKMRYQKQSTFEIKLRLLRWSKNQKKWDKPKQKTSKIDSQLDEYLKGKELL